MFRWPLRKKSEADKSEPPLKKPDLDTDAAWEQWGRCDPYFGVITNTKFRSSQLTEQAKREFFDSGRTHVDFVMHTIHRHLTPGFVPKTVLDFGCGVGRAVIPFAAIAQRVVGTDVSASMLQEAKRNCDEHRLSNISLMSSDDSLSSLSQSFDLIHSFIVFQHIPPQRGMAIFRSLLSRLSPGGIGAIHFGYSKTRYPPPPEILPLADGTTPVVAPVAGPPAVTLLEGDPEMQMNLYDVNELFYLLQEFQVQRFHSEFTDHGGELGIFLFFVMGNITPPHF
jgi:SAM-dependent methyltransferase